jgi:hypothetical protein
MYRSGLSTILVSRLSYTLSKEKPASVGEILKGYYSMQATSGATKSWTGSTLYHELQGTLDGARQSGTFKAERVITSPQGSKVNVEGTSSSVLNFCANNYLGLANHQKVVESAKLELDTRGFGLASVRFICCTQDIHKELEKKLRTFTERRIR